MRRTFFLLVCILIFFGCVAADSELSNEIQKCKDLEEHRMLSDGKGVWFVFPQARCIADLAIENGNLSICDGLVDADIEYEGVAGGFHKNITRNPRQQCHDWVLGATLNVDVCDQAKDEEKRQECRYRVIFELREPGLCLKNQDEATANRCISDFAMKLHQSSICSLAKSPGAQESCRNQFEN